MPHSFTYNFQKNLSTFNKYAGSLSFHFYLSPLNSILAMIKFVLTAVSLLIIRFTLSAQLPSGSIAEFQLNNTATDISGNNYNGSLNSTTATTNRFGLSGMATAFTTGTSTGTLPIGLVTAMQNDFSIGYWFKTNMVAAGGAQWYQGNALVDAEVCGGTNDWGTALINTGKVCMGIGNPDITIISATDYNDNNWHFLTAVRNKGTASITLYIDGTQKGFSSGTNPGALTAPGFIGLARNVCSGTPLYTGSLDDIIVYNRALSGVEVTNLYNFLAAFVLPLHWISFTGELTPGGIALKWVTEEAGNNDHYEVEHSTDGEHFTPVGTVANNAGITMDAGRIAYSFIQPTPGAGIHYYRIRQTDRDGKYSYSTTIKLTVHNLSSGLYLLSNPVHDELVLMNLNRVMVRQILILDISGRVAKKMGTASGEGTITSAIGDLSAGSYIIQVNGEEGRLMTTTLIKR
jgi:hypothetical protein